MNAVIAYERTFATKNAAAAAAGVTREMLRIYRIRGYVTKRDVAIRMAKACGHVVSPTQLLALDSRQGRAAA